MYGGVEASAWASFVQLEALRTDASIGDDAPSHTRRRVEYSIFKKKKTSQW
jgi:hypothetical protein